MRIYTPDGYDARPHHRYPVLYMHDGQNVFAHPESARLRHVVRQPRARAPGGRGPAGAVDHRRGGLGPRAASPSTRRGTSRATTCARAARPTSRFLVETLKPYVDRTYRTRQGAEWTGIMGSSLGGLISLYLGWKYPEVFGRIGGAVALGDVERAELFENWTAHTRSWTRIYLDAGEHECIDPGGCPDALRRGHARLLLPPQAASGTPTTSCPWCWSRAATTTSGTGSVGSRSPCAGC